MIHLIGSLRCANAPTLHETLDAALEQGPATVVVNRVEVRADDELGLWVLPAMADDAARRGIALVVAGPHRALRVRLRRLADTTSRSPTPSPS